jgi:osmotically-inducible protein OsmY
MMNSKRAAIVGMMVVAVSCGPSTATAIDATLEQEVTSAVHADHLDHVTVRVHDRRVTLTGTVQSALDLQSAQRDAERVEGVLGVQNNLQVLPQT